jgi:hypothetical protein
LPRLEPVPCQEVNGGEGRKERKQRKERKERGERREERGERREEGGTKEAEEGCPTTSEACAPLQEEYNVDGLRRRKESGEGRYTQLVGIIGDWPQLLQTVARVNAQVSIKMLTNNVAWW